MNRQHKLWSDDTYPLLPVLGLHWIEKRSSRGRLLEHLESSGTRVMIWGSIVLQVCGKIQRNKGRRSWRWISREFPTLAVSLRCGYTTLMKPVFKAHLVSFWSLYWLKPPFRQLRSCRCEFELRYMFLLFSLFLFCLGGGGLSAILKSGSIQFREY